jgi:hypothetical protein
MVMAFANSHSRSLKLITCSRLLSTAQPSVPQQGSASHNRSPIKVATTALAFQI